MHVVVIGGTKHVGPFIVRELETVGHEVTVMNRGRTAADLPVDVRRVIVDRDQPGQVGQALRDLSPDAVIDMIGFTLDDVKEVVTAVPSLGHYLFCSSTAVYGVIGKSTPSEATPVAPDSAYTMGKVDCENFLAEQHRERGFCYTSLRLAHPYGPGDHMLYITGRESLFLDRMLRGRTVLIPGDGQSRLHPVYVKDAARAFVHVLDRPQCFGKTYNLAGAEILSVNDYFASIARVLKVPLVARTVPHLYFHDHAAMWTDWRRKFDFGFALVNYESGFEVTALRKTGFRFETDHDTGTAWTVQWVEERGLMELSGDDDEEDRILAAQA